KSAGIPLRIGPLSKMSSFFLLNNGVRQRRSLSIRNEAEYNLDLIRTHWPQVKGLRPVIYYPGTTPEKLPGEYAVLAPQSKGSALNIADKLYLRIAEYVLTKTPLIVTGMERTPLMEELARLSGCIVRLCDLEELIGFIRGAMFVIGPNSGTIHLANALSKPILSFYPPKPTMSPTRWAPYKYQGRILVSYVSCPDKKNCPAKCPVDCMEFKWDEIACAIDEFFK
ncbi:MAG: glycosyltransferase family 9 protein, partial [Elusimicrobiota bacterium]